MLAEHDDGSVVADHGRVRVPLVGSRRHSSTLRSITIAWYLAGLRALGCRARVDEQAPAVAPAAAWSTVITLMRRPPARGDDRSRETIRPPPRARPDP